MILSTMHTQTENICKSYTSNWDWQDTVVNASQSEKGAYNEDLSLVQKMASAIGSKSVCYIVLKSKKKREKVWILLFIIL